MSDTEPTITELPDALEALKAARQQAASYRTKHANAQNTIQRLTAALTAAGLDPEADDLDTRAASLKDAAKAREEAEAARLEADVYATALEEAGLDPDGLLSRLQKLPESASDDDLTAAIAEHVKPVKDAAQDAAKLRTQATYRDAADAHGWDDAKLRKIVPNLTAREVEKDGQKVPEYGVADGDAWTPLTDAVSGFEVALKRDAQPDKPTPAPLPTGQRGGNAKPVDPVQALNSALFGARKEN